MEIAIILFLLVGLPVIYGIVIFNRLVALRQLRKNAFSDIDVQLTLRHDLIPNLVETVRKYAAHERGVLENVTQARSQAMQARGVGEKGEAELMLDRAMMNLLAVAENYPDLKADANFARFQQELADIERSIAAARRFFNNATAEYNTSVEQFPANVIARSFGFPQEPYFELDADKEETIRQAPKVEL